MTDKEKAEEICKRHIFDSNHYDCCIEMAEWKEKEMFDCAVSAYCECCDTKECEDYDCGECDWKLKFEKKLLKNLKKLKKSRTFAN